MIYIGVEGEVDGGGRRIVLLGDRILLEIVYLLLKFLFICGQNRYGQMF